ncbi:WD40 repeat domain-containing protein [Aporhodopirellula aestuarii]|uniref:SLA1 homology domain-containing protein n=1 Tax=Aporhodopirellula aestuarii TaxID=2950107 RepID=A0ABT0UAX9_9BACT|nr:WD40 repeat domain-containing protein [Aporhodopirellula aestuarii]MCM2374041.1 hypothetical protein [Aporhodopirellula aestuarii]
MLVPKAGDKVEVSYLGKWVPGVVLGADKVDADVDFTYSGRSNKRTFKIKDVRYPWQASVISPVYIWKDSTGKHSVEAAVESIDEEADTVTLIRRDDGKKITLPIDNLGSIEKRRIQILIRLAPPRVAQVPPLEEFAQSQQLVGAALGAPTSLAGLAPDPPAIRVAIPMGGAAFERAYRDESLIGVFPIGSSRGWIMGATLPKRFASNRNAPSRLIWATLDDGKVAVQHLIEPGERTIAVDPSSQQIMSLGEVDNGVATLTIWRSSPKLTEAEPLVRWASGKQRTFETENRWGQFIDGRTVLHRMNKGEYAVYDFVAKKTVYKFGQDSRNSPEPVLSPGRKYLAIPEGNSVRLIEPTSGEVLVSLPVEGGSVSSVAFDPMGEKLAVLSSNEMAVWTLGSGSPPRRVRADLLSSASRLAWVDDNHLLVGGSVLFSLDQEVPVWSYRPQGDVVNERDEPNVVAIASSRLCYGVRIGNDYDSRSVLGLVIGAVELPGPGVRETVAGMNRDELFVLEPGIAVGLEVDCGQYNDRVRADLMRHIEENQWRYDPDATIKLFAKMSRDEPEQSLYVKSNSRFGFGGMSVFGPTREQLANAEHVTRQSYRSNLTIRRGEEFLWGSGTVGALPSSLRLTEGQTVESLRNQYEKPVPEFYTNVRIPTKLYDPRYRSGFGVSYFGKHGLDPKPMADLPK